LRLGVALPFFRGAALSGCFGGAVPFFFLLLVEVGAVDAFFDLGPLAVGVSSWFFEPAK
jgi:hypothetical protein